jgi:hypothetical protein
MFAKLTTWADRIAVRVAFLVAAKSRISRARRKLCEAARRDDVLTTYLSNEDGHRV